jgi:ligand-binding sensor domain-containing protein
MRRLMIFILWMGWVMAFLVTGFAVTEASPLKKPLTFQQITPKDGLSSDMVNAIAVRGEEVWFGTYGGGATLYNKLKKTWKPYTTKGEPPAKTDDGDSIHWKNLLPYNHVSVILPDTDRIWFGTYFYGFGGGGISYFQPQRTPPWKRFNTNNGVAKKIVSLAADGDWLWVGSEKGLSILDKKTEQWKSFYSTAQGLSGNFVNALLNDSEFLWAGTNGGISRLHKTRMSWKTYSEKDGIPGEIKSLAKVGQKMWAGTVDGVLLEYDPAGDRWKEIEATDPLKEGGIQSILVTGDRVYVCRDNGVSVYDLSTGRWESITSSDGLLSNTVIAAAEDQDGIWFGTDKGVSRLILKP